MDEFGCDYDCGTVGESITKYSIPDDWCGEFAVWDDVYPIICIQVGWIRKNPALMGLKLRIVENPDDEYAGCRILPKKETIAFKVDSRHELIKAIGKA